MRVLPLVLVVAACGAPPPPAAPAPAPAPAPAAPAATPAPAPRLDGYWTGVLGGQLHIALAVHGTDGVIEAIEQSVKLPVEHLTFTGAAVHFEVAKIHGSYDGTLAGDRIDGTWTQMGHGQPLAFERGTPPAPGQEPKPAPTQAPLDAPIDVTMPTAPAVLHAGGNTALVYELHIASFTASSLALERIAVNAGVRTLAVFDGATLAEMTRVFGPPGGGAPTEIRGGREAVVFMWVPLDGAPPAKLEHAITVKVGDHELTTAGPSVAVAAARPRVIAPPLRGANWVAGNGPSNTSAHRRALIPVGGRARIAQRFAIDWVQIGDDDNTFTGDPTKNASYHAYGQPALAVAPGTVVAVKDGIAENVPQQPPAVPVTLDTVAGNHVIVDLGGGVFAMYAHFQPGSLKVKVGDRVKAGQVLGLVGNSGNSSEPHLHFQLMDAGSELAAEGLPYEFATFSAHREHEPAQLHKNEMPAENDVVTF